MFITPFELNLSLWLTPVEEYETVPELGPGPGPDPTGSAAAADEPACASEPPAASQDTTPRTRTVFKGLHWVACPVWTSRANPAWEQKCQTVRDTDDERNRERTRAPQRPAGDVKPADTEGPSDPSLD